IGIDEEAADDMIQFAEEMAAKIEEEKANAPPEEQQGRHHHQRPSPASAAAALFGEDASQPAPVEPKPTLDSLFGPADAAETAAAEGDAAAVTNGEQPAAEGEGAVATEEAVDEHRHETAQTESAEPAAHETQG